MSSLPQIKRFVGDFFLSATKIKEIKKETSSKVPFFRHSFTQTNNCSPNIFYRFTALATGTITLPFVLQILFVDNISLSP